MGPVGPRRPLRAGLAAQCRAAPPQPSETKHKEAPTQRGRAGEKRGRPGTRTHTHAATRWGETLTFISRYALTVSTTSRCILPKQNHNCLVLGKAQGGEWRGQHLRAWAFLLVGPILWSSSHPLVSYKRLFLSLHFLYVPAAMNMKQTMLSP